MTSLSGAVDPVVMELAPAVHAHVVVGDNVELRERTPTVPALRGLIYATEF
ncbi:MAG: hypothetical protein LC723_14660 [Actinobacteria bacterium]|nr:hypothetical protein [Actinomycetota bacterium]